MCFNMKSCECYGITSSSAMVGPKYSVEKFVLLNLINGSVGNLSCFHLK